MGDRAVVICSEVVDNPGADVTEAAESIRGSVVETFGLLDPIWIEHHGKVVTDGATETWELVVFATAGNPTWKSLDRATVERLVGRRV